MIFFTCENSADPRHRCRGLVVAFGLELSDARLERRVLASILGDLLSPEDQRVEVAGGNAAFGESRREQTTAVHLPALPAIPRQVAREDRHQLERAWVRLGTGEPVAIGSGMDANRCSGIGVGEGQTLLQRP